jgi:hypothetical protein
MAWFCPQHGRQEEVFKQAEEAREVFLRFRGDDRKLKTTLDYEYGETLNFQIKAKAVRCMECRAPCRWRNAK